MASTLQDVKTFLSEKALRFRETDTHFQMNCFLCGDTRERLYVSKEETKSNNKTYEIGSWKCFHCDNCGTKLSTFKYAYDHRNTIVTKDKIEKTEQEEKCRIKPTFHLQFHKSIFNTKKNGVAKYCVKERGISKDAIKHFKLGHRAIFLNKDGEKYNAGPHLAIPYIKDDKCVNVKYRSLDPEAKKFKWRREKGGISALFNDSAIDNLDYDHIYIAESELDCISLWEMGVENVIGLTVGAEGFKQPWYDRLLRFKKIYLVLDNDAAGQKGAKSLAKRLGMGRCYNVILPDDVKDPNDLLLKHDLQYFYGVVDKAQRFDVDKARTVTQLMDSMYEKRITNADQLDDDFYDTKWPKVNKVLGKIRPGYLFVLAGKPKSGKTTVALNLMKYWGEKKIHTAIYSCEMRDERLAEKWTTMVTPNLQSIDDITAMQIKLAKYHLPSEHMHTFYPTESSDLEIDGVVENCEELVQRYGLEILIIDNLHYLCRGDDENTLVSIATQKLKLMAERLDIVIVVVTHPRKTNNNKQLKVDDLKGSSSIFQDADLVWLMHRPYNDDDMTADDAKSGAVEGSMSPKTEISVTGRFTEGGKTFLAFNGERSLFLDRGPLYNQIAKEMGQKKRKRRGI